MKHLDNYGGPEPNPLIQDILIRRWGTVPGGWPCYRLVHSEYVLETIGGQWHEWDGDLNIQDRGGIVTGEDGRPAQSRFRPDRVVVGLKELQTYVHLEQHGWVLEQYFPAEYFGSPEWWANMVVPGTRVPLLGPYPSDGRYLHLVGPFRQEPPISFLEDFIADRDERRAQWPTDVDTFIKMRVEEAVKREERRNALAYRANTERLVDSASPLVSTTLEAGRWRAKQFEKSGHTSHIGN